MRQRTRISVFGTLIVFGSPWVQAADETSLGKDLTATIALHGLPCDKVIDAKRNSDSDYTASCQDGNRYHVFVDSSGRVVVKKL